MKRLSVGGIALLLIFCLGVGCKSKNQENQAEPGAKQPEGPKGSAVVATGKPAEVFKEVEPNEKSTQAMELKDVPNLMVEATLEAAADARSLANDWYKYFPAGKETISFSITPVPDEDIRVTVYDADRNKLVLLDSSGKGEGESYPNLTVDRGVYFQVTGVEGGKGGPYQLKLSAKDPPAAGEEMEINDRYSLATPLKLGEPMRGYLAHRRDEDWYKMSVKDLAPNSVLRIDLTPVEGVRFNLVAADEAQQSPFLDVKSSETGQGVVVRNMGVPGTPENIFLVVKSSWAPTNDPKKWVQTYNANAQYALTVSSEAGGADLEREPNDDAAHAMTLLDGQKIRGYLSSPDDVDYYKINVERPSLLSAELSALNRVDLQLVVVNPEKKNEQKGFELVRINSGGVNEPEILTNCALQPGENYIRVEGAWKNVDGKWIRDFFNLDETYTLVASLRTDEGLEEREPNDVPEKATLIKTGATMRGTLHPKGDVDFFLLDLSDQDGPANVTVECSGIPKLDISLKLLSADKDEKGKQKELAASSNAKPEHKKQVQKELTPGKYLIAVRGAPANESNTRDQYLLTVTLPGAQ